VLQIAATEQVKHLVAHLVQIPLFSKKPSEQAQLLSFMFKVAPARHVLQNLGLSD
jgi:hypothetical protein